MVEQVACQDSTRKENAVPTAVIVTRHAHESAMGDTTVVGNRVRKEKGGYVIRLSLLLIQPSLPHSPPFNSFGFPPWDIPFSAVLTILLEEILNSNTTY